MNNNSILKNSILLYCRMFISMIVSFYTTKVVLEVLGVADYGLRNVIAGFASMFTYFNGVLQAGTSRFIAIYIGRKDLLKLKECFGNAILIHLAIAIVILILAETIGLWFVNNELNIEISRYNAANWVYQYAIIGCIISVIQTPFVAVTTAHEKFDIYAYLSILDVILKLLIVYLLKVLPGDKLVIYSFLLLCTQIAIFFIYITVSRRRFEECQGRIETDNQLIKKMLKYSGWTATGNLSVILSNQGINVIMNIFYGTVVNAAKGLADTITWLVKSFASSILTATVPRMTKLYGEGNIVELNKTIFQSSQLCVFFISVLALPVVLEIDVFMNLWLNEVPQYTTDFIKIVLINSILAFPTTTLEQGINAIGIVKKSALWLSPVYLSYFPISYAIMYFGGSPITVYYLLYVISIVALSIQLYIINTKIDFPYIKYLIKIPITSIIIFSLSYLISYYIQQQFEPSLFRLLFICALSMLVYCFIYYTIALSKDNKKELVKIIRQKLHIN